MKRFRIIDMFTGKTDFEGNEEEVALRYNTTPLNVYSCSNKKMKLKRRYAVINLNKKRKTTESEYMICDMTDDELIVHVGTKQSIMDWLEVSRTSFYDGLYKRSKVKGKYYIYEIRDL